MPTIKLAELCTSRVSFHPKLAPKRFHRSGYLGGIGSLSAIGKPEEGTTPMTATVTPGNSEEEDDCIIRINQHIKLS